VGNVLLQSNLISLLNRALNQTAKLRRGESQAMYHCFSCHHHKRKLEININPEEESFQNWHCWTCDIKGSKISSLLYEINAPKQLFSELYKIIPQNYTHVPVKHIKDNSTLTLPDGFHPMYVPLDIPEYKQALAYLKKRNILSEDLIRYNIGFCEYGEFERRIIIPSYDSTNKLNFYIGRKYYENSSAINYKKANVPMDFVGFESLIYWGYEFGVTLVEGSFDAIAVRNNAIPLFGKYIFPIIKIRFPRQLISSIIPLSISNSIRRCKFRSIFFLFTTVASKFIHIGFIAYTSNKQWRRTYRHFVCRSCPGLFFCQIHAN